MEQLTVRGLDEELARRIRHLADQKGISLNRAALTLLRRGAGLAPGKPVADIVGSSLDHLIGTWTDEEGLEMDHAIRDLSQIERGMWE